MMRAKIARQGGTFNPERAAKRITRLRAAIASPVTTDAKRAGLQAALDAELAKVEGAKQALRDAGLID